MKKLKRLKEIFVFFKNNIPEILFISGLGFICASAYLFSLKLFLFIIGICLMLLGYLATAE